jgi:peptidoglycan/xylan/chitin deacetylase (PgdA/CDA1 family)
MKQTYLSVILGAACVALGLLIGVLAYGLAAPQATLLGPALVKLSGRREIALTFDDGPSPYTAKVLDVLRERGVPATFFLCGSNTQAYPDIARRILADGHDIGNHTFSHPYLYLTPDARIAAEIDRAQDAIFQVTGVRPTLFRPPFGVRWFSLRRLLAERGLTMVMWTIREGDGGRDAATIARKTLASLGPGAIILLHDGYETRPAAAVDRAAMVEALPAIIDGARRAGYTFVRLAAKSEGPVALK